MNRIAIFLLFAMPLVAMQTAAVQTDEPATFRSDVSLVRVDVQVLDGGATVSGLNAEDFILRENGRKRQIRNFASENMPVDVLLLLDVSASMRPHVQRIASAAHQAFQVLANGDRLAMMVFDRSTRSRLAFRSNKEDAEREFTNLLRQETFRGGTDITRGLMDAADYVARNARPDARRAIVILTDDETQMERNEPRVLRALEHADAVLCALIAPDATRGSTQQGYPPMGRQGRGGRGGGGIGGGGGPLGGIVLPSGGGMPRGGIPGVNTGATRSAGTAEIARASGGDSLPVDDASALETTLSRIRQRYSLYFQLPPGVRKGDERNIEISLSDSVSRRYQNSELRFRHTYAAPSDGPAGQDVAAEPVSVSGMKKKPTTPEDPEQPGINKRRHSVSGPGDNSTGPIILKNERDPN